MFHIAFFSAESHKMGHSGMPQPGDDCRHHSGPDGGTGRGKKMSNSDSGSNCRFGGDYTVFHRECIENGSLYLASGRGLESGADALCDRGIHGVEIK